MKQWVFALADDLTGALETGAKFAAAGIEARVTTERTIEGPPDHPVLVIDSETRHRTSQDAAAIVREIALEARRFSPWLVYKKTDSTLRGHIAAEFRALLEAFPERELVYSPAYPDMGRTVRGGQLLVHGIPVHQTAFAADSLNPVLQSDFATLLSGLPVTLHHGESNADVHSAARSILALQAPSLAAGPASFAGALAGVLPLPRARPATLPRIARYLVVNGSRHPASHAQIAQFSFDERCVLHHHSSSASGPSRATEVGQQVYATLASSRFDAIVVFGGDTAFGIHRALGSQPFEAYGEVVPGIPISRSGDLFWITKAGGFGGPGVLCDIRKRLA